MMQVCPGCTPAVALPGDTGAGDKERGRGARRSLLLRGHSQLSIGSQAGASLVRAKEHPVYHLAHAATDYLSSSRKYVW